MDTSVRDVMDIKLERTRKALIRNNVNAIILEDEDDVLSYLKNTIKEGSSVNVGGSQTLFECGVIDLLRTMPINFQDRYADGLGVEAIQQIFREAFSCDYYLASSNAVSVEGELYNVDGNGNRVAALLFGPKQVILVIGENKIVMDRKEAIQRAEEIAAPMNAVRLHKDTPCTVIGNCAHCMQPQRICTSYVSMGRQSDANKDRITVLLVKKSLGY